MQRQYNGDLESPVRRFESSLLDIWRINSARAEAPLLRDAIGNGCGSSPLFSATGGSHVACLCGLNPLMAFGSWEFDSPSLLELTFGSTVDK